MVRSTILGDWAVRVTAVMQLADEGKRQRNGGKQQGIPEPWGRMGRIQLE